MEKDYLSIVIEALIDKKIKHLKPEIRYSYKKEILDDMLVGASDTFNSIVLNTEYSLTYNPVNPDTIIVFSGTIYYQQYQDWTFSSGKIKFFGSIEAGSDITVSYKYYRAVGEMAASDILTKLKTVDGSGSGLDADKLDGKEANEFAPTEHGATHNIGEADEISDLKEQSIITTSIASSATPTPVRASKKTEYIITALAENTTLTNPTGTLINGDLFFFSIKDDGTPRTISYGDKYIAYLAEKPTETTIGKTLLMLFRYNSISEKLELLYTNEEALTFPKMNYIQGYWRLDETSGIRYDETLNHNNLSDINTVGYDTGVIGNAAKFIKANSERLQTSNNIFTEPQTELSSFNWVHVNQFNHTGSGISTPISLDNFTYSVGAHKGYLSGSYDNGTVAYFRVIIGDGTDIYSINYDILPYDEFNAKYAGKWLHIGFTFKGSEFMKIYLNGVCVATKTTDVPAQMTPNTDYPTYLGYTRLNPDYLDGLVDEAILYNIALSDSEVEQVYKIKYKKSGILLWWF